MALDDIGIGAGAGGLLGAILTFLGIKNQLTRLEKDIDRLEKDIDKAKDGTVWRTTCAATHGAVDQRLERIENKTDTLISLIERRYGKD